MRLRIGFIEGIVIFNALITALLIFGINKPSVVTLDKEQIVKEFITQVSKQNLNEEKMGILTDKFAKALKTSMEDYAHKHNVILANKEMCFISNQDVTDVIALLVAEKMRGNT